MWNDRDGIEDQEERGDWIDGSAMRDYLCGEVKIARCDVPVTEEARTGVKRSSARTVESGMLYTAAFNRPAWSRDEALGLLIRVDLPSGVLLGSRHVPLGGEARSVFVRPLENIEDPVGDDAFLEAIAEAIVRDDGRFKLYLATPAVFARGAKPNQFPGSLLSIVNGKAQPVGGWDLALKSPKPLRRAVPAGSVCFGKLPDPTNENVKSLINKYHLTTKLQRDDDDIEANLRAHMGFGLTLVGAWARQESGYHTEERMHD